MIETNTFSTFQCHYKFNDFVPFFKILSLQKIAENGKMDNKKLAETLQAVIKSHGHLEYSIEELQMKLGQKDSKIDHLKKER